MQEEIKEVDRSENQSSVIPPFSLSVEERIEWFRKKVPEFEILKSDNLTKEFLGRVLEFFNNECDVRFFMTWISPVESFGRREFLALESLFKVHPHGCLLILSRDLDSIQGYRILKPLLDRTFKVAAITPDLSFLFKNTPAETWFEEIKSGNKDPGEIPLAQNLSNLIRLAVLYKFGGIYLDTDFIVLKSFADLRNAIGAQSIDVSKSWTRLNNAVLVFDMNHPLLLKFIEEFASTFDGNKWGHNGPYLVSRVVQKVAGRPGYNFTVLPPMAFYPVGWNRIGGFFKKPENKVESRWVNAKLLQLSGETYGIHLWNRQSSKFSIEEGSVMGRLISDHCVICEYKYSS
jgi:lactosylceramide 4-alpha-galactosyltransferase